MSIILGLLAVIFSQKTWAYPEFIGYNYASCLTCHYNGHGNGALSDYGRALWASEIAGKLFNEKKSDETLGESSGFLGKKQLPFWFRPGVKSRYFIMKTNPPNGTERTMLMQLDFNSAFFFDKDQKYAAVVSYGTLPEPSTKTTISREHYFRWQTTDKIWQYFGKMDKVYGIRTVNHTAYSRVKTGVAQNDQSHGYIIHYVKEHLEATFNYFLGDLTDDTPSLRQKGFSMMFEYDPREAWRVGMSYLSSKNDSGSELQRLGFHSKQGFGEGASLLLELGLINDPKAGGGTKEGYYFFSQATQRLKRGYHLFFSGQGYKDSMVGGVANNIKASFGLIMFPLQRYELRVEAENTRQLVNGPNVSEDGWGLLSQMHLSF